jgi:acetate kinase
VHNVFLALNSGSSSLKAAAFEFDPGSKDAEALQDVVPIWIASESVDLLTASEEQCQSILAKLVLDFEHKCGIARSDIKLIAHRVVHGGDKLRKPVRVSAEIESQIESLCELAPIHNPIALKVIRCSAVLFGGTPSFAVFDTAFHSTLPELSYVYPVPYNWYEELGIRRFGFHGINHKYCSERAASILQNRDGNLKMIICHLGNGCSISAVGNGISIDTSMGFTPLEGLMMGSRSGSIDPGIIFYLIKQKNMNPEQIEKHLNGKSGLFGVSGISKDMREIEKAAKAGSSRAKLAFDLFVLRAAKEIAAMCVSLDGIDVLVFTAGIGEHSASVRSAICQRLKFIGVEIDSRLNSSDTTDDVISAPESAVKIMRIAANEEKAMLQEVLRAAL